jgi:hypothetical protein
MSQDGEAQHTDNPSVQEPPTYRAYLLSQEDRIIGFEVIEALNDVEALMHARALADKNPVELWDRSRRIIRIERKTH